jgi:hypothetical protein
MKLTTSMEYSPYEKSIFSQLGKLSMAFYGTRRFIAIFTEFSGIESKAQKCPPMDTVQCQFNPPHTITTPPSLPPSMIHVKFDL